MMGTKYFFVFVLIAAASAADPPAPAEAQEPQVWSIDAKKLVGDKSSPVAAVEESLIPVPKPSNLIQLPIGNQTVDETVSSSTAANLPAKDPAKIVEFTDESPEPWITKTNNKPDGPKILYKRLEPEDVENLEPDDEEDLDEDEFDEEEEEEESSSDKSKAGANKPVAPVPVPVPQPTPVPKPVPTPSPSQVQPTPAPVPVQPTPAPKQEQPTPAPKEEPSAPAPSAQPTIPSWSPINAQTGADVQSNNNSITIIVKIPQISINYTPISTNSPYASLIPLVYPSIKPREDQQAQEQQPAPEQQQQPAPAPEQPAPEQQEQQPEETYSQPDPALIPAYIPDQTPTPPPVIKKKSKPATPKQPGQPSKFTVLYKSKEGTCQCSKLTCLCCFKIPGLGYRTCINYRYAVKYSAVKVDVVIEGWRIISQHIKIEPKTQQCGRLPGKLLSIPYCFYQNHEDLTDGWTRVCSAFGFKVNNEAMTLRLKCLSIHKTIANFYGETLVRNPGIYEYGPSKNFARVIKQMKRARKEKE